MSEHLRSTQAMKREVSAAGGDALWRTLYHLWPYIWPTDRRDLKLRVLLSFLLLLAAKLATIAVPFTFKWATDALVEAPDKAGGSSFLGSSFLGWALAAPLLMTAGYGSMRILMAAFTQLRDGVFARVSMNAPTGA